MKLDIKPPSEHRMEKLTEGLRWVKRLRDALVLQQAWEVTYFRDGYAFMRKTEWRDVPVVDNDSH